MRPILSHPRAGSFFVPQLSPEQHEHAERVLEISIIGAVGHSPVRYHPLDAREKQACVSFTDLLIQIVVGVVPLPLRVGEGAGQIACEDWNGHRTCDNAALSATLGSAFAPRIFSNVVLIPA